MALRVLAVLTLLAGSAAPAQAPPIVLRVGTSGDYAPFSLFADDGRGEPTGFDVELAQRFAREAGFAIEWVPFRWPELADDVAQDRFDVAMSGVTWTPERGVRGFLSRAVAASGPCWIGVETPKRVAVNRGGVLERFARRRFPDAELRAVDRNRSLPELLARGEVDAIVTDRLEIAHFRRPAPPRAPRAASGTRAKSSATTRDAEHCEPASERKVYWVSPPRAHDLGPRLDAWLARNEAAVDAMRARWLGGSAPRSEADHLVDLLARRLALMPAVARAKRAQGLALVDPEREGRVVEAARKRARAAGLDPASVEALFRLQIALATRVQERAGAAADAPALDLAQELRPAIGALGDRIVAALAASAPLAPAQLEAANAAPLDAFLEPAERAELYAALLAVRKR